MIRSTVLAVLALSLLAPLAAGAQTFDPPDRTWGLGEDTGAPAAFSGVPIAPLTRAYVPDAIDLSDRFPEPGDQGKIGSCSSWATGYAARSYYAGLPSGEPPDASKIVSPASIHNIIAAGQKSCADPDHVNIEMAMTVLIKRGALPISQFPVDMMCRQIPPAPQGGADFRITGMHLVATENARFGPPKARTGLARSSLDRIKQALVHGDPVLIGMVVGRRLMRLRGSALYDGSAHDAPEQEGKLGGHALTVVGYDERRQAFRVLNSWGTGWGDGGYFWLAYDTLVKDGVYAAVMETSVKPPKPAPARPGYSGTAGVAVKGVGSCSSLALVRVDGADVLQGFVANVEELRLAMLAALHDEVTWDIDLRPWPACEALLTLRGPLVAPGRPKVALASGDRPLHVGETFSFTVTPPADRPSFLYVFYVEDDGTVVNLAPRRGLLRRQAAAGAAPLVFGDGKDGRPTFRVTPPKGTDASGQPRAAGHPERGHEMVIAIAAGAPIDEFETLEEPGNPLYRVSAKASAEGDGPPDRLFLSILRQVVNARTTADALPRDIAADVLHIKIED